MHQSDSTENKNQKNRLPLTKDNIYKAEIDNSFCAQPWVGLEYRYDGAVRPCCMYGGELGRLSAKEGLEDIYKNEKTQSLRNSFLNKEFPPACNACKEEETATGSSPRIFLPGLKKTIREHEEELMFNKVDISVSNICNLDCVMCNPMLSSKWNNLVDSLDNEKLNFSNLKKSSVHTLSKGDIDQLLRRSRDAAEVILTGGDPLAVKESKYILEKWVQEKRENQLTFITNGTLLKKDTLDLLKQCKKLLLVFSVDGVGPVHEWVRGCQWQPLEELIVSASKQISGLCLSPTTAAYNLYDLENLSRFAEKNNVRIKFHHVLSSPLFLSHRIIPLESRLFLRDKYRNLYGDDIDSLCDSLALPEPENVIDLRNKFIKWVDFFDGKRRMNLYSHQPQLLSLGHPSNM
jgi:MoaA/NifB/PqqE/SkfB family radical SAM enzyme